jgi:HTH-type transcriptional regulator / antitoxin HipB
MSRIRTAAELGDAIQRRRLEIGWTQQDLAVAAGVSRLWVNEAEGGKPRAELGKFLSVLEALQLELHSLRIGEMESASKSLKELAVRLDDVIARASAKKP